MLRFGQACRRGRRHLQSGRGKRRGRRHLQSDGGKRRGRQRWCAPISEVGRSLGVNQLPSPSSELAQIDGKATPDPTVVTGAKVGAKRVKAPRIRSGRTRSSCCGAFGTDSIHQDRMNRYYPEARSVHLPVGLAVSGQVPFFSAVSRDPDS